MAQIIFTEEEVRTALPVPRNGSMADAWEMYTVEGKNREEAAQRVNDTIVKLLANNPVIVYSLTIDSIEMAAVKISEQLNGMLYRMLQFNYDGEGFGFADTEPRYHTDIVIRKLFGNL